LPAAATDALASADGALSPDAARVVLEAFGVPVVAERIAASPDDAAQAATEIGLPVVVKIASADFPHKSDAGLVHVGAQTADEVARVSAEILERARTADPHARVEGIVVQQLVGDGVEMIVGALYDAVFGPAVMVGTGGLFAELLRDVAVRPLPIDREDAEEMVTSLRGAALLAGARGRPPADTKALVDVVMAVAALASAAGARLAELDLNPVIVQPSGAVAVDSLVIAAHQPAEPV
jgi:acyl-CoA synthetase (NDP forming)